MAALEHRIEDVISLFNQCFLEQYNTRLVKGGDEPIYLPSSEAQPNHELHFAHGYYRSALHETAHWLIAGASRRQQVDFGYWYEPDGRSAEQQKIFEQVEVKPQALEWMLSEAAGIRFRVSVDNLNGEATDSTPFKMAVFSQVLEYIDTGLWERAERFRRALCRHYERPVLLHPSQFDPESL